MRASRHSWCICSRHTTWEGNISPRLRKKHTTPVHFISSSSTMATFSNMLTRATDQTFVVQTLVAMDTHTYLTYRHDTVYARQAPPEMAPRCTALHYFASARLVVAFVTPQSLIVAAKCPLNFSGRRTFCSHTFCSHTFSDKLAGPLIERGSYTAIHY